MIGNVFETSLPRNAHVVDQNVESAECSSRLDDDALGLTRLREIRSNMGDLADPGRAAPTARDHASPFGDEKPHRLEPDPSGRTGDETPLAFEPEIHSRG